MRQSPGGNWVCADTQHAQQGELKKMRTGQRSQAPEVDPGGDPGEKQESDHDTKRRQLEEIDGAVLERVFDGGSDGTQEHHDAEQAEGRHPLTRPARSAHLRERSDSAGVMTVPS